MVLRMIVAGWIGLWLAVSGASAATVHTFLDFSGSSGLSRSKNFSSADGDVSVRVEAFRQSGGVLTSGFAELGQYSGGLGISTGRECYSYSRGRSCYNDDHQVDGRYTDEIAVFDFNRAVTLESVVFSYFNTAYTRYYNRRAYQYEEVDTFDFAFYGNGGTTPTHVDARKTASGNNTVTYDFARIWTGNLFGIGASENASEFKIRGVNVSYDTPITRAPSPVPLPAAGFMFLTGLGSLLVMRRWKAGSGGADKVARQTRAKKIDRRAAGVELSQRRGVIPSQG